MSVVTLTSVIVTSNVTVTGVCDCDKYCDRNKYGVHYCSKHFEHIFDFLTPFLRPGGQIPLSGITS